VNVLSLSLLTLFVFLPSASEAGTRLSLSMSGFTAHQEGIVRQGAINAVGRMATEPVMKCVLRSAKRGHTLDAQQEWRFKDKEDLSGHLYYALMALKTGGFDVEVEGDTTVRLHIIGASLGPNTTGRAYIGIVKEGQTKFEIQLNKDMVGKAGHFSSADVWAETIAHEMLHNVNLTHGSVAGADWDRNYKEFVITEWGYCVESNGANGSGGGLGLVGGGRPRYNN